MSAPDDRRAPPSRGGFRGRFGFLKLVLILFGLILTGLLIWQRLLGSGDGTLPFDYEGFG
jgi:hypothetical protein